MARFILIHTDENGEMHQLTGAWDAESHEAAIAMMLAEAREADDGSWSAHVVTSDDDVIGGFDMRGDPAGVPG
jgi:hypothetical protein